jgi:hypothetical protein
MTADTTTAANTDTDAIEPNSGIKIMEGYSLRSQPRLLNPTL